MPRRGRVAGPMVARSAGPVRSSHATRRSAARSPVVPRQVYITPRRRLTSVGVPTGRGRPPSRRADPRGARPVISLHHPPDDSSSDGNGERRSHGARSRADTTRTTTTDDDDKLARRVRHKKSDDEEEADELSARSHSLLLAPRQRPLPHDGAATMTHPRLVE